MASRRRPMASALVVASGCPFVAEANVFGDLADRFRSGIGMGYAPAPAPAYSWPQDVGYGYGTPTYAPYQPQAVSSTAPPTWAPAPGPSPDFTVLPGTPNGMSPIQEKEVLKAKPWQPVDGVTGCSRRFQGPEEPPLHATDLNGMRLPDVCLFDSQGPHHVFAIGDWGGLFKDGHITPADHRSRTFPAHHRKFVVGADDVAQQNVAAQMRARAPQSQPEYVLNVGDNFYWGGVTVKCGAPAYLANDASGQWKSIFEDMYTGFGLDGKQWLGVLGNHDYGGWMFTMGWDQAIAYTWAGDLPASTGRWMTPAQYYSARVRYNDFSVDYFFVDNNVFDAFEPDDNPPHNICSRQHNPEVGATCGQVGPVSVEDCPLWFKRLWNAEIQWLAEGLAESEAQWQVVVMHFPPEGAWGEDVWKSHSYEYGIDLIIAGHRHRQSISYSEGSALGPTGVIITGGGGGITSEGIPDSRGADDQYGFVDLSLTRDEIMVEMISHGGQTRSTTCITPRGRRQLTRSPFAGARSLCGDDPNYGTAAPTPPPTPAPAPTVAPVPAPAPQAQDAAAWQQGAGGWQQAPGYGYGIAAPAAYPVAEPIPAQAAAAWPGPAGWQQAPSYGVAAAGYPVAQPNGVQAPAYTTFAGRRLEDEEAPPADAPGAALHV